MAINTNSPPMTREEWDRLYEASKHPNLGRVPSATCPRTGGAHVPLGLVGRGEYPDGSGTRKTACAACAETLTETLVKPADAN